MPLPREHSARLETPRKFLKKTFRSKTIRKGVRLIIAKKCSTCSMKTQAVRFNHCLFSAQQARKWLRKHGFRVIRFEVATRRCVK